MAMLSTVASRPLVPAIVVLNAKYLPKSSDEPARVGATAFGISVIDALRGLGVLRGIVLYWRDESLCTPHTVLSHYDDQPCVTVYFNFRMQPAELTEALASAFAQLGGAETPVVVYYQTDVLLDFHPPHVPFAVTHHGPFVADVAHHLSPDAAAVAFGGADKVSVLRRQQDVGMRVLARSPNGFAILHSTLQARCLLDAGVPWDRCCFGLTPPIRIPPPDPTCVLPNDVEAFLRDSGNSIILFTAVARLDFFKNIPLLVDTAVHLWRRGVAVRLLVAGDSADDEGPVRRAELVDLVPSSLAARALIVPRLPKPILYALFRRLKERGVFVCTSRYETLGITPLEAAAAGMPTLVPESARVEASVWFPKRYRVMPDASAIAARITALMKTGVARHGSLLEAWMAKMTSEEMFRHTLSLCWAQISDCTTTKEARS